MLPRSTRLLLVSLCLSLGCSLTGPQTLETGRTLYNVAVQETNAEQLLLNLVRLRYRDTPVFLTVANVSTNFEFETTASANASFTDLTRLYGLGVGGRVQESPTITYTPLAGELFVKQLLSPIELDTLLLLYHSGWAIDRVLRVCIQRINRLQNAPSASGPTPDLEPEFREFQRATLLLRQLQRRGLIELGAARNREDLRLRLHPEHDGGEEWREFAALLGLDPARRSFRLTVDLGARGPGDIRVVTRSVMADLFYVSHTVEASEEDVAGGRVTVTRTAQGEFFDWREVSGDLLYIHSQKRKPDHASVATKYRGRWFYVDDADLSSKSTFALLMQLLQLQAGEVPSTGPLLTLPVSR